MTELAPEERHLEYMPAPVKPTGFDRNLRRLVGVCPNGVDTYLRFIWGCDRTEELAGRIIHRYPDPNGRYVGVDRWVLEGWQSPDVYDRNVWDSSIMGDWPTNGVWDFIATLQDEQGRYLSLGHRALQMAREWRMWKSKDRPRLVEELLEQRCKRQVLAEKRAEAHKQALLDEFVRDYSNAQQGTHDPRRRELVAKIDETGKYRQLASGVLVPNFG